MDDLTLPPELGEPWQAYLSAITGVLGRPERQAGLRAYCTGLLLPGARKSIEPIAARLGGARQSARHQALHHFVTQARWSDEALLDAVAGHVLPAIQRHGPISAWILDDTAIPKRGAHSVGVAVQYCGVQRQTTNCQVAVSLSLANAHASLPVAFRLYLPEAWATDRARRGAVYVPLGVRFQTKHEIALDQIRAALAKGLPRGVVLADGAYGNSFEVRHTLRTLGLSYAVGVDSRLLVRPPGHPVALTTKELAGTRRLFDFRPVTWRHGRRSEHQGRFAALRVTATPRHAAPDGEEWLLIEWPLAEPEPTRYWLSTLPPATPLEDLVATAKGRWRIERDYQELKQQVGLDHFEGRSWRGFHHHAALCIAAYGFLVQQRCRFPPPHPRAAAPGPGRAGPPAP